MRFDDIFWEVFFFGWQQSFRRENAKLTAIHTLLKTNLVGGFNPFEKYYIVKLEISPNRGENEQYFKPTPSNILNPYSYGG